MSNLIQKFLQRPTQSWSPEDLEQLAQLVAEERAQLRGLVDEVQQKVDALHEARKFFADIEDRLGAVVADQRNFEARMKASGPLVEMLESLDGRVQHIARATGEAEDRIRGLNEQTSTAEAAIQVAQELLDSSRSAEHRLESFNARAEELGGVEGQVQGLNERLDHHEIQFDSLVRSHKDLTSASRGLEEKLSHLKAAGAEILGDFEQAKAMAAGMEDMLSGMVTAKKLARKNEEQLHNLNALWEHVSQKVKSLDVTKQALERADAQARKVDETVWGIEERLEKFSEESGLIRSSEESFERLQLLFEDLSRRIDQASQEKESLDQQTRGLLGEVGSSLARLQEQLDRSQLLRQDIDLANGRVAALSKQVRDQEDQVKILEVRGQEVIAASRSSEELVGRATDLKERLDAFEERVRRMAGLESRLDELGGVARRVDQQVEFIAERQELVEVTERRLGEMSGVFAEVRGRLDSLKGEREDLDQALQLFGEFRKSSLETRNRIKELSGDFERLDGVSRRLEEMRRLSETLEGRVVELSPRLDFVEAVESRLNRLDDLSQGVDVRIESQLAKQNELESLRLSQESLALQLDDLKKLASSLQSSQKLTAMEKRLTDFEDRLEASLERLARSERLDEALTGAEERVVSLAQDLERSRATIDSQGSRLEALDKQGDEAGRLFEGWMDGVTRLEARQREVEERATTAEVRLQETLDFHGRIEVSIDSLAETETRLDRYQERIRAFESLLGDLDRKVDAVNSRHTVVDRVKRDVEKVFDTFEQGREEAVQVLRARQEISSAKEKMDDLAAQAQALDRRLGGLKSKLGLVEEAEAKVDTLNNIVHDIGVNLGHFEEQRAVIEHLAEKLAKADHTIKQAELATQTLREERRLAFRIQQGIKSLRSAGDAVALSIVSSQDDPQDDPEDGQELEESRGV